MKIIAASAHIEDKLNGAEILRKIEKCGRTCYKSEEKATDDSARAFVAGIIKRGHESVLEHVSVTVRFICDRGVSHEIVRHRIASYSQESTRYCDYADGHITYILPCWIADVVPGVYDEYEAVPEEAANDWLNAMWNIEKTYKALRQAEWSAQEARSVLPNSVKTEVVMSADLREWRHFFKLRCAKAAHPQMREVAIPLLHEFQEAIPVIFDDLTFSE